MTTAMLTPRVTGKGGQWLAISSHIQPTSAQNLRQGDQTIQYLLLRGARGVGGVSQKEAAANLMFRAGWQIPDCR